MGEGKAGGWSCEVGVLCWGCAHTGGQEDPASSGAVTGPCDSVALSGELGGLRGNGSSESQEQVAVQVSWSSPTGSSTARRGLEAPGRGKRPQTSLCVLLL